MGGTSQWRRVLPSLILCLAIGCVATGMARGQSTSQARSQPTTADTAAIRQAIAALSSESYQAREDATKTLWEMGKAAEPALRAAAAGPDKEAATRATAILRKFRMGVCADTPPDVAPLLEEVWTAAEPEQKKQALLKLLGRPTLTSKWLTPLAASKEGEPFKPNLLRWLEDRYPKEIMSLGRGQPQPTEEAFALGAEMGFEPALSAWTAYLVVQDKAQEKIQELSSPATPGEARLLAFLYRATSQPVKAVEAAAKSGDEPLQAAIELEQGHWAAARGLPIREAESRGTPQVEKAGLEVGRQIALARLTGGKKELDDALAEMADLWKDIAGKPNVTGQYEAIHSMLFNEQFDLAAEMMRQDCHLDRAIELLVTRTRYLEAMELAEKSPTLKPPSDVPAAVWANLHTHLGHRRQLPPLRASLTGMLMLRDESWIYWYRRTGLNKESMQLGAKLLAMPNTFEPGVLEKLFDPCEAPAWWPCLKRLSPKEPIDVRLERLRTIMQGDLEDEPLAALLDQAAQGAAPRELVGLAMFAQRRGLAAAKRLAIAAADSGSLTGRDAGLLGYLLMHMKEYERAAAQYAVLITPEKPDAVATYLQGWNLQQIGQKEQAAKLMARGDLLMLGSENARLTLAEHMDKLGQKEEAARQRRLVIRCGRPTWSGRAEALRRASQGLTDTPADCLAIANGLESARLFLLASNNFGLEGDSPKLAYDIHQFRMKAAMRNADLKDAEAELSRCLDIQPRRTVAVLLYVQEMDRRGRKALADAAFDGVWKALQAVIDKHPEASGTLDEQAWLAAKCRRKLTEALVLSEKAVQLLPEEPRPLITMAELHFQLGQKEKAIETLRRAMRKDACGNDLSAFYRRQLQRYEKGDKDAPMD